MEEGDAKIGISKRLRHAIAVCAPDYTPGNAKWSLKVFSRESGIPYRTLQDYISGSRLPGADALQKIARRGVDINWILLGDERSPKTERADINPDSENDTYSFEIPSINNSEANDIINAMCLDFVDKINYSHRSIDKIIPFIALMELAEIFRAEMITSYLRTIDAIPHFESRGMTVFDMLNVLRSALDPSFQELAQATINKYDGWTNATQTFENNNDDKSNDSSAGSDVNKINK